MVSKPRPNFLIIVTDQHRADHLSCAGNKILKTPHIDALAAGGRRYDRFYVSIPICMPNRATLLTGRMPSLHGAHCNGAPLRLSANTAVWMLRAAGYRTRLVGKSHLQNMTGRPPAMPRRRNDHDTLPPPDLSEAWLGMWQDGRYDQENTELWASEPEHRLDLPFYGFDDVELCTMHGDVVGGEYRRWLDERCPEAAALIGAENALPDERYRVPQAYRTRIPEKLYPTSYVVERTNAALEDLGKNRREPFFLVSCFPDPHHPFTPPGRYWDMYDPDDIEPPASLRHAANNVSPALQHLRRERASGRANTRGTLPFSVDEREAREAIALTYGMISMIDDGIGRITRKLDELGLTDDTIVVFMSDHGDFMGDHGLMLKSALHYQGLIRVPFIWKEPDLPHAGEASGALHSTLDVARTVLARAGIAPYWGMQGKDMAASLADPMASGNEAVLIEEDGHEVALGFDSPVRVRSVVTDRWRLSVYEGVTWGELYDLENDRQELINLFDDPAHRHVRAELFETMARLMMSHADRSPYPTGRA
ncbi:MAG: sulfatase [Parvibaculaceae bacterium]